ncbi:hypothetical protein HR060_00310 [Catenovulum sp. SM1970]|uniref:hypothetical protein n=1 Tax=Marinifaba aquimaris TaxID=2741323 RepID=UPI001573CB9A|nr:hypothetical protein [Marinifaba aquimaris]NTS75291.1 hypothetical protein [Marinifaba aquimaris]
MLLNKQTNEVGEVISTVKGSQFGRKLDYNDNQYMHFRFDDAETGAIDEAGLTNSWASITDTNNRAGSQFSVLHESAGQNDTAPTKTYQPITTRFGDTRTHDVRYNLSVDVKDQTEVNQYFASVWVRLSGDFANLSTHKANQANFISFQPDRSTTSGLVGGPGIGASGIFSPPRLAVGTGSGELTQYHGDNLLAQMVPGQWHRVDAWVSVNDASTNYTDVARFWLDGELITERQQAGFRQTEFPQMQAIHFVNYMKNLNDGEYS